MPVIARRMPVALVFIAAAFASGCTGDGSEPTPGPSASGAATSGTAASGATGLGGNAGGAGLGSGGAANGGSAAGLGGASGATGTGGVFGAGTGAAGSAAGGESGAPSGESGAPSGGMAGSTGGGGTAGGTGGSSEDAGTAGGGQSGAGGASAGGGAGDTASGGAAGSGGGPLGDPTIVLVAGTGTGGDGSLATEAEVLNPYGAVVDPVTGDVYIAEVDTGKIRHIDADGLISTVVGPGAPGAPGSIVLNQPHDLLFQPGTRILFIADTMNGNVYRMDAATGEVAMFAGSGAPFVGETRVYCLGFSPSGTDLYFTAPDDIRVIDLEAMSEKPSIGYADARVIALDSKGTLYAVKNRPNGDSLQVVDAQGGVTDMPATLNVVSDPKHLAIDLEDNVMIADTELFLLRKYDVANDTLTTVVGNGVAGTGMLGGAPELAQLRRPHGVFVDNSGVVYVSDSENDRVLKIVR